MGIEEEIIFMFNQYRKKADKLIVSRKKNRRIRNRTK